MVTVRFALVACCLWSVGCAHAIVGRTTTTTSASRDAILVLPGFGYSRAGEQAFRALAPSMKADGIDLYLPTFVSRAGLDESRDRLRRFIREQRLSRYARVHVFAFIAGGWTFNPMVETDLLPNLSTVVYDRSPYQERAPRVALDELHFLTWVKYGSVVFDVARTPYVPLTASGVRVGLVVETEPTAFIKRFATAARRPGPYQFACDTFQQRYDDCFYVAMSHDELYRRFADVWPEVQAFIRTGRFTPAATRTPTIGQTAAGDRP